NRHGSAYGIDLTWAGLQYARTNGAKSVARATVAALPFRNAQFGLVTSFDVLYSLPDEVEGGAIAEMYRVLEPGGTAIVNVAALEALKGTPPAPWAELRRYSRTDLTGRLERAGFHVTRATYTNLAILPLVAAVRFRQRLGGAHVETEEEIAIPPA